jgi:hypothetical protein
VNATVIGMVRPIVLSSVSNWVPKPIGPVEICSARTIRGLYRGSLRPSAMKSEHLLHRTVDDDLPLYTRHARPRYMTRFSQWVSDAGGRPSG